MAALGLVPSGPARGGGAPRGRSTLTTPGHTRQEKVARIPDTSFAHASGLAKRDGDGPVPRRTRGISRGDLLSVVRDRLKHRAVVGIGAPDLNTISRLDSPACRRADELGRHEPRHAVHEVPAEEGRRQPGPGLDEDRLHRPRQPVAAPEPVEDGVQVEVPVRERSAHDRSARRGQQMGVGRLGLRADDRDRRAGVGVGEQQPLAGQPVDLRGGDLRVRVAGTAVAVTEVIGEDENDVRKTLGGGS